MNIMERFYCSYAYPEVYILFYCVFVNFCNVMCVGSLMELFYLFNPILPLLLIPNCMGNLWDGLICITLPSR